MGQRAKLTEWDAVARAFDVDSITRCTGIGGMHRHREHGRTNSAATDRVEIERKWYLDISSRQICIKARGGRRRLKCLHGGLPSGVNGRLIAGSVVGIIVEITNPIFEFRPRI